MLTLPPPLKCPSKVQNWTHPFVYMIVYLYHSSLVELLSLNFCGHFRHHYLQGHCHLHFCCHFTDCMPSHSYWWAKISGITVPCAMSLISWWWDITTKIGIITTILTITIIKITWETPVVRFDKRKPREYRQNHRYHRYHGYHRYHRIIENCIYWQKC